MSATKGNRNEAKCKAIRRTGLLPGGQEKDVRPAQRRKGVPGHAPTKRQ